MNENREMDKELVRQIEADPSKFIEFRDNNGNKIINHLSSFSREDKTVVKENNQNSYRKENYEDDYNHKKHSKHKKKKKSRSRSKRRSQSRSNHKSNRKKRSISTSRSRTKSLRKNDKIDLRHKQRDSRSPQKNLKRNESPNKDYLEKRRRVRSSSRSAYIDMKLRNTENGSGFYQRFYERPHEDNDPNKPQLFWDGFQWVVRGTTVNIQTFDLNTKPGRKVQIANIPLHLNISIKDLKEFIYNELVSQNYIDKNEKNIIKGVDLDYNHNAGVFVMESIDYAKRITLLDGIKSNYLGVKLVGYTLRISTYNEVPKTDKSSSSTASNSTIGGSLALANTAHLSAKSAAIAFAAIQSLSKNDQQQINLNNNTIGSNSAHLMSSKVIKVMNVCDQKDIDKYREERFHEIEADMTEEFDKYGKLNNVMIVKPKMRKIGAEIGSVFVEFDQLNHAEFCMKNMKGRRYDGREIKCAFMDEDVYFKELQLKKEEK